VAGSFTSELWDSITDIYGAILAHPFITGLTDGTLPAEAFAFFVLQDGLYLKQYASALAAVASKAPEPGAMRMFARHAADAVTVEQELHSQLLPALGISARQAAAVGSATIRGGTYAEGIGAVLPCYWIYREVGKELVRQGSPDSRYQRWIDTYGGDEFGAVVRDVIAEADRVGTSLSESERVLVARHFRTTSRYEWMFWDMGYRKESWPV
jgi:thiaminase (transcriptional activator TenA)